MRASDDLLRHGVLDVLRKGAPDMPLSVGLPTAARIGSTMNSVTGHTEQPCPDRATTRAVGVPGLPGSNKDLLDDIFRLVLVPQPLPRPHPHLRTPAGAEDAEVLIATRARPPAVPDHR